MGRARLVAAPAATSPAWRIMNPADAARPPLGATNVITGTGEATIFWMISCMAVISPPGVFSRIITAWSCARAASSRPRPMISVVKGCIT
jgi:hypothetical protein